MKHARIVVTGAAGFVGTMLATRLIEADQLEIVGGRRSSSASSCCSTSSRPVTNWRAIRG